MKIRKSYKYKNYGSIPQNEYATADSQKSTDDVSMASDPQPDDTAYRERLTKRQAQHPSGRRKTGGWARSWKANGWRVESAAQHDERANLERHSGYVQKSPRPLRQRKTGE